MMDLATIRHMNREAGETARDEGCGPYVFSPIDLRNLKDGDLSPLRKVPRIGDYEPEGWIKTDSYFVDSSGFGGAGEPALTASQFAQKVEPGVGYGIGEVGQFQIYIDAFEKEED